jgi:hypothetical protein
MILVVTRIAEPMENPPKRSLWCLKFIDKTRALTSVASGKNSTGLSSQVLPPVLAKPARRVDASKAQIVVGQRN